MKKRFLTAAISAIFFAIMLSCFLLVPANQREPNVYDSSFLESFFITITLVMPVFILVGLPLSILIDKLVKKFIKNLSWASYLVGLGLYSLVSLFLGFVIMSIFNKSIFLGDVIPLPIGCFMASTIYYHLLLLVTRISRLFN